MFLFWAAVCWQEPVRIHQSSPLLPFLLSWHRRPLFPGLPKQHPVVFHVNVLHVYRPLWGPDSLRSGWTRQPKYIPEFGGKHSLVDKSAHSEARLLGLAQFYHVWTAQGNLTVPQGLHLSKENRNWIYTDVWPNDLIVKSAQNYLVYKKHSQMTLL